MSQYHAEVEQLRAFLCQRGNYPGECVDVITTGNDHETLVAHFAKSDPRSLGDDEFGYVDTPSTIAAVLNRRTGTISIPDLL
jgi:hypothetical protein